MSGDCTLGDNCGVLFSVLWYVHSKACFCACVCYLVCTEPNACMLMPYILLGHIESCDPGIGPILSSMIYSPVVPGAACLCLLMQKALRPKGS